jgi:hypothetical protein
MKQKIKTKAEVRETKKKLKMKISGKSVFKLKNIIIAKSGSQGLTK